MMPDLPNWVMDLLIDLEDQSAVHPKLLFESGAFTGTRIYDWCPCQALEKVPANVRANARAIAAYRQKATPGSES